MNHVSIGVYNNETHVVNIVPDYNLEKHIEYNKIMRFGRALFIDGECVHTGYLSDKKIETWSNKIKEMDIATLTPSTTYY
ncbi:TPA: hypothetical protein QCY49_000691 [Bacillus paranthracis]|nr:hypothetical protein [Bacillus paranthracis]